MPKNFPALKNALDILLLERRFPSIFRDLEKGIYSLYKNRQLAKTLGQNGKKGVCNFYDSSHMASAAMEIFTDIATKFISTATHS